MPIVCPSACRLLLICLCAILLPALRLAAYDPSAPPLAAHTPDGFPVPRLGWAPEFPRSNASHPEFRIEWWYITGHLFEENGSRYGFQVTFFRSAHPNPPGRPDTPGEAFGLNQIYLAHMAITDTASGRFLYQERLNRAGWDASASEERLDVRNGSWFLREITPGPDAPAEFELMGTIRGEARFDLRLRAAKPAVVFGSNGVSRKSPGTFAASHYLTYSRLEVSGSLSLDGGPARIVRGQAWFDHEFGSSQLSNDQVGWDWASLQFDDGREIMAYVLRRRDGTIDPFSTLAWIDRESQVQHHPPAAFRWEPVSFWTSPTTGARYPVSVRITAPDPDRPAATRTFTLRPFVERQELRGAVGGIPYWEGACEILDEQGRVVGSAYLELTGYAGDLSTIL
jgi:predicted secreted hydrolase